MGCRDICSHSWFITVKGYTAGSAKGKDIMGEVWKSLDMGFQSSSLGYWGWGFTEQAS